MSFAWTDREGRIHQLNDPQPILAEAEVFAREIDRLVGLLENAERAVRDGARVVIGAAQARLDVLLADCERWNDYATGITRQAALDMVEKIDRLPVLLARVMLVVALHDEQRLLVEQTAGLPAVRAERLAAPMTDTQRQAIAACNRRSPLPATASRSEAMSWLDQQPQFARQPDGDDGWFAWVDRHDYAHRLAGPLRIETEMVTVARELRGMRVKLAGPSAPDLLYSCANEAGALWEHLSNLQAELERLDREAEARDLAECKAYAADWRSKRNR